MAKRFVDTTSNDRFALESDTDSCVKLNSSTQQNITSNIQVNGWVKVGNLQVNSVGGSSSQGYSFASLEFTTEGGYKVFKAYDHAINTFTLSDATPVKVVLPNATDQYCRDLILKVDVTSEIPPQFIIVRPSDVDSMGIEYSDEKWAELEQGVNYFTITETQRI